MNFNILNKKHKKFIDFFITILLFYMGCLLYLYFFQRSLMYHPGGERPSYETLNIDKPEIVSVSPEPGLEITGWYWKPSQEGKPVILYFHGNAQDYQYWMDKINAFRAAGYGALLAEYRGFGGNTGDPSESGFFADAISYMNYLNNQLNVQPENIVLYGESLGTGVAVQIGSQFPVKALILESAYASTADIAVEKYRLFPVRWLMIDQFRSIDRIRQVRSPLLFMHAIQDQTIPIHHARKLFDAANEPKTFVTIPEGGHNDLFRNGSSNHALSFLRDLENSGQL
jgi:fermentation-respiration switch protein FrsA (DUF1100 family)